MNKLWCAVAVGAALLAGPAAADGMRVGGRAPAVTGCANFGGFYVGGHGGWIYHHSEWTDQDNYGYNFTGSDHIGDGSNTDNGWLAGFHAGYNMQRNCTVFGVQVDWSWANAEAQSFFTDFPLAGFPGAGRAAVGSHLDWLATIRGRTGLVVDNLLLYLTGGFAWANVQHDFSYSIGAGAGATTEAFTTENRRTGFVVGVGTDWLISDKLSVNSEILYLGFDNDSHTHRCTSAATCLGEPVGTPFRYEFQDSAWVGRIGLSYRLGVDRRAEPLK